MISQINTLYIKMDKTQKLEYQQQLDSYMEDHQIYDLLQGLMKALLQEKPKEPLDFLIARLEKPQPKRTFIVGPPGCEKSKMVQELANELDCASISMAKIFEKQISKQAPAAEKIELAKSTFSPIDNETAIELLVKKLKKHEAKGKNSIVAGFPLNVVQALALQSKGIVANRVFILNSSFESSYEKALKKLQDIPGEFDREALAKRLVTTYYM